MKVFSEYYGKYFDKIKLSGIEIGDESGKIRISEFGFNNLDFKKVNVIKKLINSTFVDETEKNNLSLIMSMTFDKLYFKNINFKTGNTILVSDYFEINDWKDLSFKKILATNLVYKEKNDQHSFEKILIEDYKMDINAVLKSINSKDDKLFFSGDYTQISNSLKSLENFEIKNYKTIKNNKKLFSVDLVQIEDFNFDYFGEYENIKVPTSLNIKIDGSDFNSNSLDKNFSDIFNQLGYSAVKFNFESEWKWNTNKNDINLNLDFGI